MTSMARNFCGMAIVLCLTTTISSADERPNILIAFADDWGRYASVFQAADGGGSPNDVVKTPNIDRVAREGVLFRRAYVTAPSCTPCRSSLLSGQYFWRTGQGAILSGAVWDANIPAFPLLLRDGGYHIGETYKVWSPGTPNDAPFGGGRYAFEKRGGRFNKFSTHVTQMAAKGKPIEEAKQELYREVEGNFDDFLAARKTGQPFCYWFGPTNVHRKWIKGSGKALWNINPDDLAGKLPKFLPDVPEIREDFADYLGEIQAFDAAVGLLLKKLEAIGELDRTLVVLSGDHGPPGFTHGKCNLYDFGTGVTLAIRGAGTVPGRVVDDFVNLIDLAPTFCETAGLTPPAVMTGRSLTNVLRSDKSGQVDPARSYVVTGRERHVDDAREGFLPYPHRALRTKEFHYIVNFKPDRWPMGDPRLIEESTAPSHAELVENTRLTLGDMDSSPTKAWLVEHRNDPSLRRYYDYAFAKRPAEELYAIATDPDEIVNLANDPKYAEAKQQLNRQLLDVLASTQDPRVVNPEGHFEKPPFAGPIEPAAKAKGKGKRAKVD